MASILIAKWGFWGVFKGLSRGKMTPKFSKSTYYDLRDPARPVWPGAYPVLLSFFTTIPTLEGSLRI